MNQKQISERRRARCRASIDWQMSYPKRFERPPPGFVVWSRTIDQIVAAGSKRWLTLKAFGKRGKKPNEILVGVAGFEPATPASRTQQAPPDAEHFNDLTRLCTTAQNAKTLMIWGLRANYVQIRLTVPSLTSPRRMRPKKLRPTPSPRRRPTCLTGRAMKRPLPRASFDRCPSRPLLFRKGGSAVSSRNSCPR
jgi:hypothetical protein